MNGVGSWRERVSRAVPDRLRTRFADVRDRVLWGPQRRATVPEVAALCDPENFRKTMGLFPTPVSVVTALDADGVPRGLTCSAVCSLSMEPPSMLVCVNRRNRSLEAIRHSQGFVVNLLRAGRDGVSAVFASASPSKFSTTDWARSPLSGLPMLTGDALAVVECGLQAEIVAGSHVILIGLVRQSGTVVPESVPLVYWCRSYGTWTAPDLAAPADGAATAPPPLLND